MFFRKTLSLTKYALKCVIFNKKKKSKNRRDAGSYAPWLPYWSQILSLI